MLALAIAVLLSVIAMPTMLGTTELYQLRLAAEAVANEYRLAQSFARSQGIQVTITYWTQDGEISIYGEYAAGRQPLKERYKLPTGIRFDAAGDASLGFTAFRGTPVIAGGDPGAGFNAVLLLTSEDSKTNPGRVDRHGYVITVAVNSGRVSIHTGSYIN